MAVKVKQTLTETPPVVEATTNLPSPSTCTMAGWFRLDRVVGIGQFNVVFSLWDATHFLEMEINENTTTMLVFGGGSGGTVATLVLNRWHYVAMTVTARAPTGYVWDASGRLLGTASDSAIASFTPGHLGYMNDETASTDTWDGAGAYFRVWDGVALTQAELQRELRSPVPVTNLSQVWGAFPMTDVKTMGRDYNPRTSNHLTVFDNAAGGIQFFEAGPPKVPLLQLPRKRPPLFGVTSGATRGVFMPPPVSGLGIGGSFFRDPLQEARI